MGQLKATLLWGSPGASYPLPRKNFNPPLPIIKGDSGEVKFFRGRGYEDPWDPHKRVAPNCLPLPIAILSLCLNKITLHVYIINIPTKGEMRVAPAWAHAIAW